MLTNFQSFFTFVLDSISTFLLSEPIIWVFGLIMFLIVVKVFLTLLNINCF